MFFGGTTTCDDFTSGTVVGGVRRHDDADRLLHAGAGRRRSPQALENYFEKIDRCKPVIDVGFHIGVTDLARGRRPRGRSPSCPTRAITSYKLFMAYKGAVMVDDETLFKTMRDAADTGALVMVHAENGDAIDVIVKRGGRRRARASRSGTRARGRWRPRPRRRTAPSSSRGSPAPALRRPRLLPAGRRADRARAREGLGRLGRDLHAVPVRRRQRARPARLRGREVRLHAAAAAEGAAGAPRGRRWSTTFSRSSRPTTARSSGRSRRGSTARSSR